MKIISYKHCFISHTKSGKAFKATVVNRALANLHAWSLEITLTVPLRKEKVMGFIDPPCIVPISID